MRGEKRGAGATQIRAAVGTANETALRAGLTLGQMLGISAGGHGRVQRCCQVAGRDRGLGVVKTEEAVV